MLNITFSCNFFILRQHAILLNSTLRGRSPLLACFSFEHSLHSHVKRDKEFMQILEMLARPRTRHRKLDFLACRWTRKKRLLQCHPSDSMCVCERERERKCVCVCVYEVALKKKTSSREIFQKSPAFRPETMKRLDMKSPKKKRRKFFGGLPTAEEQ